MSAFNNMMMHTRDRNWGGTSQHVAAEPYVSGYSFVKWILPACLNEFINANGHIYNSNDQTELYRDFRNNNVLDSACTSVTPPGGTLNTIEFQGLGGTKWGVPGSIDYGSTITLNI
jgi:hypothetical protein